MEYHLVSDEGIASTNNKEMVKALVAQGFHIATPDEYRKAQRRIRYEENKPCPPTS